MAQAYEARVFNHTWTNNFAAERCFETILIGDATNQASLTNRQIVRQLRTAPVSRAPAASSVEKFQFAGDALGLCGRHQPRPLGNHEDHRNTDINPR